MFYRLLYLCKMKLCSKFEADWCIIWKLLSFQFYTAMYIPCNLKFMKKRPEAVARSRWILQKICFITFKSYIPKQFFSKDKFFWINPWPQNDLLKSFRDYGPTCTSEILWGQVWISGILQLSLFQSDLNFASLKYQLWSKQYWSPLYICFKTVRKSTKIWSRLIKNLLQLLHTARP